MKLLNKIRKMIIITITALAAVFSLLFILAMDSLTINQLLTGGMITCICGMWMALFIHENCGEE